MTSSRRGGKGAGPGAARLRTQEFGRDPGVRVTPPPPGPSPMDVTYAVITKPRRVGGATSGSDPSPSGPSPSPAGFNSRIRKPKGPREPPADWTRT
ncbi:hypothetical protein AV530_012301 [Patagioenas fasciata monilis]|uniref:Uncharacterized protein n=1 Tax=Patagioenas fasciata monilis TaxID=372326 RepID=A0A1V4K3E1_PATFA|nr:hypothetical protein AV530_012301 [Patagioenas fasciata monilis]